ncbi:MAG: MBOAT family protein [Lachnospiraceae bacterium]|nr:MBOAT family protein [Lachnospiraceae bacterium]
MAALVYFVLPGKVQNYWLLLASFFFYMNWNPVYGLLLLASILITYLASILIEKKIVPKGALVFSLVSNLGLLAVFKYSAFFAANANALLGKISAARLPVPQLVLPVGISFYVFQALGYTMDVYHGREKAERNFFRYALFVSFFPQLVAGPIERSKNLLPQFHSVHRFDADRVRSGLLTMLWGLFLKIVIADRIALIVTEVFGDYLSYNGAHMFLASLLFTLQIYCDFGGYSYIAIGSAKVLGFTLMDNFRSPLLSSSVREFWKRWHISLTTWFTDYLYIPLGGNRKGTARRLVNVMIVFLVSGLWHGADWTYVLWGGLNGLYLVAGHLYDEMKRRRNGELAVGGKTADRQSADLKKTEEKTDDRSMESVAAGQGFSYRFCRGIITYLLISFAFFIFRANSITDMIGMLRQAKAVPGFSTLLGAAPETLAGLGGLDAGALIAFMCAILLLIVVDTLQRKEMDVVAYVLSRGKVFRWLVYLVLLGMIMIFGVYGNEYTQTQFIYFQF